MPNVTFDFAGRTAIVTGAARGLGLEFARLFHRSGAKVFLVDADADEVALAADELGAVGAACDVTSTDAVKGPGEPRAHCDRSPGHREIAATTAFLASEEAGYITGVVLPVDGGISI